MTDHETAPAYKVTETINGAHPTHVDYPLLPGDLLLPCPDGTWTKEAPGLAVGGFVLPKNDPRLTPVTYGKTGPLEYFIAEDPA